MHAGEGVIFLKKSDLVPYPMPAPLTLRWIKSPPYADFSHLNSASFYIGLIVSNRGVLLKEKVCLVLDLLTDDPFIYLKDATEVTQNFYFINFII